MVGSREVVRPGGDGTIFVLDGYVQVASATSAGFEVRMTLPRGGDNQVNPDWALQAAELVKIPSENGWIVSWGVEG